MCRKKEPAVEATLLALVDDDIAGEPASSLCWIRRSSRKIKEALAGLGFSLCRQTIRRLLRRHNIRPKSNVKRLKGDPHPDRDRQFTYIERQRQAFTCLGQPVISVDAKKKELIGTFRNPGRVWCAQATPVNIYDFPSLATGKAVPYGIYDPRHNDGYVAVGQSADTPEFAVDAIVAWWQDVGQHRYPAATDILILADGGGSNGYRPRRWKQQLQVKLADALGLTITVAHYPTGASKWNPIEHRLFSQITQTWAGIALTSFERVLAGIRHTTTTTGLSVDAILIDKTYATGLKVTDKEMAALEIERHDTCPAWNYTIHPRKLRTYF